MVPTLLQEVSAPEDIGMALLIPGYLASLCPSCNYKREKLRINTMLYCPKHATQDPNSGFPLPANQKIHPGYGPHPIEYDILSWLDGYSSQYDDRNENSLMDAQVYSLQD
jgi:hypothetical protein